jgi:hypothetical protein
MAFAWCRGAAHNHLREELRMTQQNTIRLLIADDHEVLRSGVKAMLAGTEIKVIDAFV